MESTKRQYRQYLANDLVRMKDAMYSLLELFGETSTIPIKILPHAFAYYGAITTIGTSMFGYVRDSGVSDAPEEVLRKLIKTSQDEHSKLLNWYISEEGYTQEDLMKESLETVFIIRDYLMDLEEQLFSSIVLIMDTQKWSYEDGTGIFDIWNQRGKPWEDIEFKKPQEPKEESKQGELFENPEKEVADYDDSMFKRVEDEKDRDGDIPF